MKKLYLLLLIINSLYIFAQDTNSEKQISKDSIYTQANVPGEYPGGISAFRTAFTKVFNFNPSSKGKVSSVVSFVVSEQGQIEDIVATGENKKMNKEMEKAIKKLSNVLWKPAEIDGKPVKFRFRLPISMEFHN
ncbi:hypothetical protein [Chryseobacterium sp. 5_R23647]|jgi:protein TonB|uniref:hypothetical protein n=1 Tax=Chryseobacterium sp. 5_R23647 TaxID=2258964 RepID=UPI000E2244BB|nr:hypothetical protein [Chryseobacterium sp. 5_R23647]REC45919.1 hypothetical protein DRF69_02070 [Chryseobacterium sp. 5_R23647]